MERRYREHWGFNAHAEPISFWSRCTARAGGVAILLNPYEVSHVEPAMTDMWSEHFIAIRCTVHQQKVLVANVYAPQDKEERERLFEELSRASREDSEITVLGGDFNCTQDCEMDRSFVPQAPRHVSAQFTRLLAQWGIVDALHHELPVDPTRKERDEFHQQHHTYQYSVGTEHHSSRLDRLYVSQEHAEWIERTATVQLGIGSDHASVETTIVDPRTRVRARRPRKVYPPKRCAEEAVHAAIRTALEDLLREITDAKERGESCIDVWTRFKHSIVQVIRNTESAVTRTTNSGYKRKVARIRRKLNEVRLYPEAGDQVAQLTAELDTVVREWQALKSRRLTGRHSWGHRTHSAAFSRRVACRSADYLITALEETVGISKPLPDDLQYIMADAWTLVLNEEHTWVDTRGFHETPTPCVPHATAIEIDAPFTIEEVLRAINTCSRTKSGGPDRLPNSWYRDFSQDLAPVLLCVLNECYMNGIVPASFGDATVVCLKKSRSATNPLNYRPISLLNTDYKIYARLLAARLKPLLPGLVAEAQGGFVPGRSIHDVIDWFTAAQHAARTDNTTTLAVLLDIKKAYDSVNREYLVNSIKGRGFGTNFVQAIVAAHAGTWATFQVNGLLSHKVRLTRGIRQGCPLAPLLFVLVLDLLYHYLLTGPILRSPLPSAPALEPVAGYADDTALFVADESRLPYAQSILDDFSKLSGLSVNKAKSVVVRLNAKAGPVANTYGMRSLPIGDCCRHLGVQVGTADNQDYTWKLCVEQLRTRLRMAQVKTNSVSQRAALAKAIVVPKIAYVARHCWPTLPQVEELDLLVQFRLGWPLCDHHG